MEMVKCENATSMDKSRALLDSVIRKEVGACQIFITYICEEDCHLAEKLGLSAGQTSGHHLNMQDSEEVLLSFPAPQAVQNKPTMLTSSGSEGNVKLCPSEEAERIQLEQSAEEMTTELEAFAHYPEHKTSDSTFLVFMSHEEFEDDANGKAHIEKDFIAFCFSTPDNVSWRHPTKGFVFIMRLIEHLQEYVCSCDVEEIFRKVRLSFERTDGRVQMPTTERVTLTSRFYLFSGC
ncbi:Caspase-1 [Plecturocebus cupreus]